MNPVLLGLFVTGLILLSLAVIAALAWLGFRIGTRFYGGAGEAPGCTAGALVGFAIVIGLLVGLQSAGVIR